MYVEVRDKGSERFRGRGRDRDGDERGDAEVDGGRQRGEEEIKDERAEKVGWRDGGEQKKGRRDKKHLYIKSYITKDCFLDSVLLKRPIPIVLVVFAKLRLLLHVVGKALLVKILSFP